MIKRIVHSTLGVTVLGAGEAIPKQILQARALAPDLVAADGGAVQATALGLEPIAVIGDFDSLQADVKAGFRAEILHHVREQETTDLEKCLARIDAPGIIALGVLGPRLDHGLAAIHTLLATGNPPLMLVSREEVLFHCPSHLTLDLPIGARVSLFPMLATSGRSRGLEWPIAGLDFRPGGRIGTSNRMAEERLELSFDAPGMIVLLEVEHLPRLWRALTG